MRVKCLAQEHNIMSLAEGQLRVDQVLDKGLNQGYRSPIDHGRLEYT